MTALDPRPAGIPVLPRDPRAAAVRSSGRRGDEVAAWLLNALAALYAEQHGDTADVQAERQDLLDRETLAYSEAHAWERAIAAGLAELRGAA